MEDNVHKLAQIMFCVGCVLKILVNTEINATSNAAGIMGILGAILQLIGSVAILYTSFRWCRMLYSISKIRQITTEEWDCTIYILLISLMLIELWIFNAIFNASTIREYTVMHLLAIEISFTSFAAIQAMYQRSVLRQQSIKFKAELEFKRMFVRYISHEVRTPLNTAIMGLQLLDEELRQEFNIDCIDTLKDIRVSCDIAVNVLNELLTFDKLEAGTLMVEKTSFNGVVIIKETVHQFQIQARSSQIALNVKILSNGIMSESAIFLIADKNKISQIIRNMVSNGLKFTPPGGTVDVLVNVIDGTAKDGKACKMLKVNVVHSGAGISPENQKKLFKSIVQFNPGQLQKGGGSGLGLYISYGIANLHDGSLSVYSEGEGHGCTFTLTLPCHHDETKSTTAAATADDDVTTGIYRRVNINPNLSYDTHDDNVIVNKSSKSVVDWKTSSRADGKVVPMEYQDTTYTMMKKKTAKSPISVDEKIKSPLFPATQTMNNHTLWGLDRDLETSTVKSISFQQQQQQQQHCCNPLVTLNLHMLIVDDTAISRKMQCRLLKKRCSSYIEAENGQEAVDKVSAAILGRDGVIPIDLVIMDCNMPVLNGMDAARVMRDMGYKGIIIGVTGSVSTDDISKFISHGADMVLAKPLDMRKFDMAVEELFGMSSTTSKEVNVV